MYFRKRLESQKTTQKMLWEFEVMISRLLNISVVSLNRCFWVKESAIVDSARNLSPGPNFLV